MTAESYGWNRLVQIHGLAVAPAVMRRQVGTRLVEAAEGFARAHRARGIYVDTPVDNVVGRAFYTALGYAEAYVMPRYHSDELDGVTFAKFFD